MNDPHPRIPGPSLLSSSADPVISINSGQMFLWQMFDNSWYGIYGDHILKFSYIAKNKSVIDQYRDIEFFSFPEFKQWERHVFRLDDDIQKILSCFSNDSVLSDAMRMYPGLRVLRQDPYQCMISFVCASNTNIAMIRRMLGNICRKFGDCVIVDGRVFFTFPHVDRLNKATTNELLSCGVGYRAKAIKAVASNVASKLIDIGELRRSKYCDSKQQLMKIYGIGNKIADCILLFSLDKLESFPIDIWIRRALYLYYRRLLVEASREKGEIQAKLKTDKSSMQKTNYDIISEAARIYFGKYAGYAQQYLYYYIRERAGRKW